MSYPLFLDLSRLRCLVVGAGAVGRRKIAGLLDAGARDVLVLDPGNPSDLPDHPSLRFEARAFRPEDLAGRGLVFAATGSRQANAAVTAACAEAGVLCNCADAPHEGNCAVPASARMENLAVAVSTGGAGPAYAALLRDELAQWLSTKAPQAVLLGRIRPALLALKQDTGQNANVLRALARPEIGARLAARDRRGCEKLLEGLLPAGLHSRIADFLDGLV